MAHAHDTTSTATALTTEPERKIEDHHLMHGLFLTILCTHDELYLEPHGAILLLG